MNFLFRFGAVGGDEVVGWADVKVTDPSPIPDALLDLVQTAPKNTAAIISHLTNLSRGADYWSAFRQTLGLLHDYLVVNRSEGERIARALYCFGISEHASDVPDDLNFIFCCDDGFSLVRDGVLAGTMQLKGGHRLGTDWW
ncbi:MAG: hypothetical protein EBS84_14980 [Proteobacteria bacterium]|nr:hypothetical protein [Verrucomicrobiota bacterium]NBU10297.1 hypothetical protein [Pseudomonadota bacterium]